MAKGKYGRAAPVRRANDELETDLGVYQRRVRDLTAEVRALKAEAARVHGEHQAQLRIYRAEISAGTSAKVEAQELVIKGLREEIARRRGVSDNLWDQTARLLQLAFGLLVQLEECSPLDADALLFRIAPWRRTSKGQGDWYQKFDSKVAIGVKLGREANIPIELLVRVIMNDDEAWTEMSRLFAARSKRSIEL